MDIVIAVSDACALNTDNVQVAVALLAMVTQAITPDAWVGYIPALLPDTAEPAKKLATLCLGLPV